VSPGAPSSRDVVLGRIREALAAAPAQDGQVPREYVRRGARGRAEVLELFVDRLVDYKAEVVRVPEAGLGDALKQMLAGVEAVVVPADLPAEVTGALGDVPRLVTDTGDLSALELDRVDAVVTTAAAAIAVNGVIVLDAGPGQGRRILTLIPDLHVVVLRAGQIVETVPEAVGRLDPVRPTTWIAGPSATSDIELSRVEGVHGPRTLRVVITG
jgi:L-lactate dehydrogenase complex protein LldG